MQSYLQSSIRIAILSWITLALVTLFRLLGLLSLLVAELLLIDLSS